MTIPIDQLSELDRVEIEADFHCVTTWTVHDLDWSGWLLRDVWEQLIVPHAMPSDAVTHLRAIGADSYASALELRDALAEDILIADRLEGRPLDRTHGAPLRLVAPAHYGYKNVKHLSAIEFRRDRSSYRFASFKFMDHPRARVALEERGQGVSPRVLRRLYPYLIRPVAWLFQTALDRHERLAR